MDPIKLSQKLGGKIEVRSKAKLSEKNLSVLYTPGVADVSRAVALDKKLSFTHTIRKNSVAVISDGSAVLGLGNIGPEAALPVMEGKAVLFKELADVDAFPIVLNTQDPKEIINIVKNIAPTFGGINLEDISAPRCFEIEKELKKELDIPVFHDDQHGTAIVVLAGLINACVATGKKLKASRVVISGAGAAGASIAKILFKYGVKDIIVSDSRGIIHKKRKDGMNAAKSEIAKFTNPRNITGDIREALNGADIFVGVSAPNILKADDIKTMNKKAIVFAMSNPIPEIMPDEALKGGAAVVATGRSDFPNQINNALVFPGIFRGALDKRIKHITDAHKIKAARALAGLIKRPTGKKIMPKLLDKRAVKAVAGIF